MSAADRLSATLAQRVVDSSGREWARKYNGVWACLGQAITVDSLADLEDNYGIAERVPA